MRNRLKHYTTYLAGSIDESKHTAHLWRNDISKFLWKHDIGVFDPCNKPGGIKEEAGFVDHVNAMKKRGEYDEVCKTMTHIVKIDLHMVDLSNFVILAIDRDAHLCGSYNEQTYAALEKKPVIVWCQQGKDQVPSWLFGMGMRHEMMFGSLDEVKNYILSVAYNDTIDDLGRWRFIDYDKVFNKEL